MLTRLIVYFEVFMIGTVVPGVFLLIYEVERAPDATTLLIEHAI